MLQIYYLCGAKLWLCIERGEVGRALQAKRTERDWERAESVRELKRYKAHDDILAKNLHCIK